jgi:four helix bundle protein
MMGEKFPELEDLNVWKYCRELKKKLTKVARGLPQDEKYRLTDQVIRASRSITNNIAEGYGRFHYQENIQYLRQSRGSLYECIDHLYCVKDDQYIPEEKFNILKENCQTCLKLLNGYIKYLKNRKSNEN